MSLLSRSRSAVLAASAGLLTLASVTTAAADASLATEGDLNGDGVADTITLTAQAEGTEQRLSVTAGGQTHELTMPLGTADGAVRPVRVTDVNADGKAEVLVVDSTSDQTTTLVMVDLGADGLRVAATPEGQELRFFEGGGAVSRAGYTCQERIFRGREFTILFAVAQDDSANPSFIGTLASYKVANGVATPSGQIPIFGVKGDNPQLQVDPAACNP
ncbi:FG-GAP repeat domain-containing protein [Actinokineospora pegani]|uniref:FG-GAP repeat domain-containing protein n=1 Tax=Actinokineospora pegani TaxID=2654637 RepID=UPI0012EAA70B|nr:VCBS repeat-containing protein [Actinokineospora pegani]